MMTLSINRQLLKSAFGVFYTLLFCGVTFFLSYMLAFTRFLRFDDEGLVLYDMLNFSKGVILYEGLMTQYGPAFYIFYDFIWQLLGSDPTHAASRWVGFGLWVIGCAAIFVGIYKNTKSLPISALTFFCAFKFSTFITSAPVHPASLIFAFLCFYYLLLPYIGNKWTAFILGLMVGFSIFVKINAGVFLLLGVSWPLLWRAPANRFSTALKYVFAGLLIILPVVLFGSLLWAFFDYALVMVIASVCFTYVWFNKQPKIDSNDGWVLIYIFAAATFLSCSLIVLSCLALGVRLPVLYYGVIGQFSDLKTALKLGVYVGQYAAYNAVASLIVCVVVHKTGFLERSSSFLKVRAFTLIQFFLCLIFFALIVAETTFAFRYLWLYGMPWLWVLLVPASGSSQSNQAMLYKGALIVMALLQGLYAFPVGRGQIGISGLLTLPIFAMIFARSGMEICNALPVRFGKLGRILGGFFVCAAVATVTFSNAYKQWVYRGSLSYAENLTGSSRIKVREGRLAELETLTNFVEANADTLLTVPGLYSFSIWSGVDSPTYLNQTNWPYVLSDGQQNSVIHDIAKYDRVLVIRENTIRWSWDYPAGIFDGPVSNYIAENFVVVDKVGDYEILAKRQLARSLSVAFALRLDNKILAQIEGADIAKKTLESVDFFLAITAEKLNGVERIVPAGLNNGSANECRRVHNGSIANILSQYPDVYLRLQTSDGVYPSSGADDPILYFTCDLKRRTRKALSIVYLYDQWGGIRERLHVRDAVID